MHVSASSLRASAKVSGRTRGERVLVVEDNAAQAQRIAAILAGQGCCVTACRGADEAQRRAAEHGFDVALVDVALAGAERGLELIARLKGYADDGEIVRMTSRATLHTAMEAIHCGVFAFLPKPVEEEELAAVTQRALAQVALRREKQALVQQLAASEALYRWAVETVEASILGLDRAGSVRFANRFACTCFGRTAAELTGCSLLDLVEPRSARVLGRALEDARGGMTARDRETFHRRGGRTVTMRWTLAPLDGAPVALPLLAVGLDVGDRVELERRSASMQAMAEMGTLATSLAHEVRGPLSAARRELAVLSRRVEGVEGQRLGLAQPTRLIGAEIDRLSQLLDDFLSLARAPLPARREVALAALLAEVVAAKKALAESLGVRLQVVLSEPALTARIDADKLRQVLVNLVRNAIDARRPEGGEVVLTAEPRAEGGVFVSVSDDGLGLSDELRDDAAFQPFITTKPAGTGLGLAIVRKIVAQHDGDVALLPRPGGGTIARFWVSA